MIYRFFGAVCVIAALGLGAYIAKDFYPKNPDAWSTANPAKRIAMIVEKDLIEMKRQNELPPEWFEISKATYKFESSVTKVMMGNERPQLNLSKKRRLPANETKEASQPPTAAPTQESAKLLPATSTASSSPTPASKNEDPKAKSEVSANKEKPQPKEYEVEIDVIDVPDETEPGFIFQMSLFESDTKNKIYELGRTYHWSSLNKTSP